MVNELLDGKQSDDGVRINLPISSSKVTSKQEVYKSVREVNYLNRSINKRLKYQALFQNLINWLERTIGSVSEINYLISEPNFVAFTQNILSLFSVG